MEQELVALMVKLGELAVSNSAASIGDKIATLRAKKQDRETIEQLVELINSLIADKSALVSVAQSLQQHLVAQQIAPEDVTYISETVVPLLSAFISNDEQGRTAVTSLQALLSEHTVTMLQLLGFNFREAIGEPLTEVVRAYVYTLLPKASTNALPVSPHGGSKSRRTH